MMIAIGAAGVFMQAFGLQLLLRLLGETKVVRLAVLVYGLEEVGFIVCRICMLSLSLHHRDVYVWTGKGSTTSVHFPML